MTLSLTTHLLSLQAYETWATAAVFESLGTVPPENTAGPAFTRALQILGHVQLARRVWFARVEGRQDRPDDWFPAWTLGRLRQTADELDKDWHGYVLRASADELSREVAYTSSEGVGYTTRVSDILTHVYNHSTYHRGQVARLITEAGGRRATTDYVAFARRQV